MLTWLMQFGDAVEEARRQRKPILLQFHRDRCSGCRKLYAWTYQDTDVQRELSDWFVPLRLDILQAREVRSRLAAFWTPSFYVLDHRDHVLYAFPGFLGPEDLRVLLRLGRAAWLIPRGKYREAASVLEDGLAKFPDNPRAATLALWRGMARYLLTWDNKTFRADMTEILRRYPDSPEARMWPWMDEPELDEP